MNSRILHQTSSMSTIRSTSTSVLLGIPSTVYARTGAYGLSENRSIHIVRECSTVGSDHIILLCVQGVQL
eukprot:COSAG02_NODE_23675_length_711_cov_1.119281_1_plen_70_part_00